MNIKKELLAAVLVSTLLSGCTTKEEIPTLNTIINEQSEYILLDDCMDNELFKNVSIAHS